MPKDEEEEQNRVMKTADADSAPQSHTCPKKEAYSMAKSGN
jgi:hypothetical protein